MFAHTPSASSNFPLIAQAVEKMESQEIVSKILNAQEEIYASGRTFWLSQISGAMLETIQRHNLVGFFKRFFILVSETKLVIVEQDMAIGLTQTQTRKVICRELAYQHMISFIPDLEVEETSVGERVQKRSIPSALSTWTAAQMLAFFWLRESF